MDILTILIIFIVIVMIVLGFRAKSKRIEEGRSEGRMRKELIKGERFGNTS